MPYCLTLGTNSTTVVIIASSVSTNLALGFSYVYIDGLIVAYLFNFWCPKAVAGCSGSSLALTDFTLKIISQKTIHGHGLPFLPPHICLKVTGCNFAKWGETNFKSKQSISPFLTEPERLLLCAHWPTRNKTYNHLSVTTYYIVNVITPTMWSN